MRKNLPKLLLLFFFLPVFLLGNDMQVVKGVSPAKDTKYPISKSLPVTVEIKNAIGPALPAGSWYLGAVIKDKNGNTVYSGSMQGGAIGVGETKQYTFSSSFISTASQEYSVLYYLDFSQDINTSNNSITQTFSTYGKPWSAYLKTPTYGQTGIIPNPSPDLTFEQPALTGVRPVVTQTLVFFGTSSVEADPSISPPFSSSPEELNSFTYPWPLDPNKTYYWTIVYGNSLGNTTSSISNFITGATDYSAATLLSPGNNATNIPRNPLDFYWDDPDNALSVDFYIGTTPEAVTPNVGYPFSHSIATNTGVFTVPADLLQDNETYYWRIVEQFGNTYSMSQIRKFTTNDQWFPNPVGFQYPHDGDTDIPTNCQFRTEDIAIIGDDPFTLDVFVGPTIESVCPDQGHPVTQALNVYSVTYIPKVDLNPNSDYYARTAISPVTHDGSMLKTAAIHFPGKRIQFRTGAGPVSVFENKLIVPDEFRLSQNYPNPFNPSTKIKFGLPSSGEKGKYHVELIIYDILGKKVDQLLNEEMSPGTYEVEYHATQLSSGIYFYQLKAGDYSKSVKMILLK